MSVLIKTMEMPETCGGCQFRDSWICHAMDDNVLRFDERDERCPLTEVPTPHGRLIDADAFSAKIMEIIEAQGYDDFYTQSIPVGGVLREVVHELRGMGIDGYANAPTIIPADSAKEGKT